MSINYDKMRELQEVLAQMFEIEDKIKEIPMDLNDKEALLQKAKIDYLDIREKCTKLSNDVEALFKEYNEVGKSREEKEKQMETTTLSRECENLLKEIEIDKEREKELLKKYNGMKKYLSELEMKLEISQDMVKTQEEEVSEEVTRKDALIAEQEVLLNEKKAQRNELAKDLPQNLLFKFERIIRNKGGIGVVPVHGIICQGCHMELPQQFANEVRKNDDINFCPYCSRILFYEPSEEDENVENLVYGDVHTDEDEENEVSTSNFISSEENLLDD